MKEATDLLMGFAKHLQDSGVIKKGTAINDEVRQHYVENVWLKPEPEEKRCEGCDGPLRPDTILAYCKDCM